MLSCANPSSERKFFRVICAGIYFFVLSQFSVLADDVTLTWNPSTDTGVAGYKIYYGTASRVYTNSLDVGNDTNVLISGLVEGTTYFFAATTYDSVGDESDFSTEVSEYIINTNSATAPISNPVNSSPTTNNTPVPVFNPPISPTNSNPIIVVTNSGASSVPNKFTGNQAPTLNPIANFTVNENSGLKSIVLSGITSGATNEHQTLQITAVSSNPNLIANLKVIYINPQTTGTLTLRPAINASGSAAITVAVNDGGKSNNIVNQTFTVTVSPTGQNNSTSSIATTTTPTASPTTSAPTTSISIFAPIISKQLTNMVAMRGKTVSLSVAASGIEPLRYQWKFNGVSIPSAKNPVLTMNNVQANQAGSYSISISNPAGTMSSSITKLEIYSNTAAVLTSTNSFKGQFNFSVAGISGYQYVVQASSNLKDWVSIQTNTSPFAFSDVDAAKYNQRFYRTYCLQ
jgi:hypothetical protein